MSEVPMSLGSQRYRLTAKGRACVDLVESGEHTVGSLSRYLHDILMLCGSGVWFEQLRQFMPPRSLGQSLASLMALGLVEQVAAQQPDRPAGYRPPAAAEGRMHA
jgi:hypothetical protein